MQNTSFHKIIDNVFDRFKRLTPALFAVSLMTGLVLFLPNDFLNKLALNDIPYGFKIWLGIVFLLSSVLIITIISFTLCNWVKMKVTKLWLTRKMKIRFHQLNKHQKIIINALCQSKTNSIKLNYTSGDTIYLETHGFILAPDQIITEDDLYANLKVYIPQPWLIELYEKNPTMFEL